MRETMIYNADTYQFREGVLTKVLEIIKSRNDLCEGKTLFFGDSLVENIPARFNVLNHGLGGTCSRVWESLLDELVIKFKPKKVFFQIGTNDLGETVMASPREIALNVQRIFYILSRNLPNTQFYMISTLPCIERIQSYRALGKTMRSNAMIQIINRELQDHLSGSSVHFIDLNHYLFDKKGEVLESFYSDGLHLNEAGYDYLEPKLKALVA